jgi:hypothetical protein
MSARKTGTAARKTGTAARKSSMTARKSGAMSRKTTAKPRRSTARRPSTALELHVPHPTMPHVRMWNLAVPRLRMPHVSIPRVSMNETTGKALWFGGLVAVAAIGVIEWPVAAVVAVGSVIMERRARGSAPKRPANR